MAYQIKNVFNTPAKVLSPTTKKVNGVVKKEYVEICDIFCSFKGFGGTERELNDVFVVENTAVVETFFRPDIKNDCRLKLPLDNSEWEILNIENIEMRNQFLKIKVKSISGKA